MHLPPPRAVLAAVVTLSVGIALACTDASPTLPEHAIPVGPPHASLSTGCSVTYTSITYNNDSEMAPYGVPARTDTSSVCETWTGGDYYMRSSRIGSSEPLSETSDEAATVEYSAGVTTIYRADGSQVAEAQSVGSDAFAFGQATDAERQASYNDPYYGIAQSQQPGGCPNDPTAIYCFSTSAQPSSGAALRSVIPEAGKKEHGHRRRAIRALLSDKDEVPGAPAGMRRFRSVKGDEETLLDVDDEHELLRSQETNTPTSHSKATLSWTLRGDRFVRDRMEVDGTDTHNGKQIRNKTVVLIQDVRFDRSVAP